MSPKLDTVADSFAAYQALVIPAGAPAVQVEECRRAFYAGAYFLLMNVAQHVDEHMSEEEGAAELVRLRDECEAFAASIAQQPPAAPLPDARYTIPDPENMTATLQELGVRIGQALPAGWGFNLLLFTYGEHGSLFYISSAAREDVVRMMQEFIRRQAQ